MALIICRILLTGASAAEAQQAIPLYDPDNYCEEIANVGGPYSESTKQSCIEIEQEAYDSLKDAWGDLPDKMQKYCDEIASVGGKGSYSTLNSFIEIEQEAVGMLSLTLVLFQRKRLSRRLSTRMHEARNRSKNRKEGLVFSIRKLLRRRMHSPAYI